MSEKSLEEKVNELIKMFGGISGPQQEKIEELAKQARDSQEELKKSMDNLMESLDYLRICIKYQVFDLEATRRENKHLKQMLEEK
jgi:hypothetical protein